MIAVRVLLDSRVVRESVFTDLPVTIGRAPDSTFPLADPSVSRAHARIEPGEDGRLRVVDLGSRNGLQVDGRNAASAVLDRRLTLRLGQTTLELASVPDDPTIEIPVAALRRDEGRRGAAAWLGYLALGVAALVASQLLEASFWSPWNHTRWVSVLGSAIGFAVALPLLAGLLFLVLKVIGRRVRMADTLRALGLLAWLAPATNVVLFLAYYLLSPSQYASFQLGLGGVTGAVAIAILASVRREPRSRVFTLAWAGSVLVVAAAFMALSAATSRQNGQPNVDLNLQAPLAGYAGRAESLDDYLVEVRRAAEEGARGTVPAKKGQSDPKSARLSK